jgi:kinesin family protein C1
VQLKIISLSAEHEEQRAQLNKAYTERRNSQAQGSTSSEIEDSGPSEEWRNLASRSNELLSKLDSMAQQAGDSICDYLEKYDQHVKTTASDHIDTLQKKLETNLDIWNKEMKQKREFEEKLLQEYGNGLSWYQREIQQLQGEKVSKETALEQLHKEFSNERQKLNDEYQEQLSAKQSEYSRLVEKHYRQQERLVNWHSRKLDEKNDKWQERLASEQQEIARLLHAMKEEQVKHQKETQEADGRLRNLTSDLTDTSRENTRLTQMLEEEQTKYRNETQKADEQAQNLTHTIRAEQTKYQGEARKADEEIRNLCSDITKARQELDLMSKQKQELEVLLDGAGQRVSDEVQALRRELDEIDAKNKSHLQEIEQLRKVEVDVKEHVQGVEGKLRKCQEELVESRENVEEASKEIRKFQESHQIAIKKLREEYSKEKKLVQEEHEIQIRKEQEKQERLEQLTESLRNSKLEQTDLHCIALEERTRKWQDAIDKKRGEWQKELDQSNSLLNEARADILLRDTKIQTLQEEVEGVQEANQTLASELEQAKELSHEAKASIHSKDTNIQALRREVQGAQQTVRSLTFELEQTKGLVLEAKDSNQSRNTEIATLQQGVESAQKTIQSLTSDLGQEKGLVQKAEERNHLKDTEIQTLQKEVEGAYNTIHTLTSEVNQAMEAQQSASKAQEKLILLQQEAEKDLSSLRQALEHVKNDKESRQRDVDEAQKTTQTLTTELDQAKEAWRSALETQRELKLLHQGTQKVLSDVRWSLERAENDKASLQHELERARKILQTMASKVNQAKEAQRSGSEAQQELKLLHEQAGKDLDDMRQAFERAESEKALLSEQVSQLETVVQNAIAKNQSLEASLKATTDDLKANMFKEASAAWKESEGTKEQIRSLENQVAQVQHELAESQAHIKQRDSEIEQLNIVFEDERKSREMLEKAHKARCAEDERRITELSSQLSNKVKQMEDLESAHNARIAEQGILLEKRDKMVETLHAKLAEEKQNKQELQETMKQALVKEEAKRSLIFNEFQKLRKDIRVMCRIRPSTATDRNILEYETSEGKFHSKPAGLEIISHKSQYGTSTRVVDRTKHYNFDRIFEAHETNEDVWLEISQFVQSFVDGRKVTIFCYGQTATGKTYTMSNSDHAFDANGEPILTNEGIMPRSKALIFEEVDRRKEKGWSVLVRGCCYEVYMKEIRLLLPNRVVKAKSLNPAGPPWWHVRDPEYQYLNSVEDFDEMFESAMESRTFAETTSNSNSSRSHFILYLEFETKSPTMKKANRGSLCLVDLAGSEDPHKASNLEGDRSSRRPSLAPGSEDSERKKKREQRMKEGIAINQSLRVLRKSISKIRNPSAANGKPTLEGGDEESSTLAKLLGPCLGRESMVLMFVMVNLEADCFTETKATLESGREVSTIVVRSKGPTT